LVAVSKNSIKHHNFNALLLLYDYSEEKDKNIVVSIIIDLLNNDEINKSLFLRYLGSNNEQQSNNITMKSKLYEKIRQFKIMERKRDELITSFTLKNDICNDKNKLDQYLKTKDINLKETRTFDFDILIKQLNITFQNL